MNTKAIWFVFDLFLLASIGGILILILLPRLNCQITRLIKDEFAISLNEISEDTLLIDYPDFEDIPDVPSDYKYPKRDKDDASEDYPRDYFDYDDSSIRIRPCHPTCHQPYVCDTRYGHCVAQSHRTPTEEPKP